MSERIAIYGASGHGQVVADVARRVGYEPFFIDDGRKEWLSFESFFQKFKTKFPVALGIGDNTIRRLIFEKLKKAGLRVVTLIDPGVAIGSDVKIGEGSVVMPGVVLNAKANLGRGVIVNSGAIVEHECVVGDFVHLSPRVALAGGVKVGAQTHVGIGASVVQEVEIGEETVVGAGAVVVGDLPSRVVAVGVPATVIKAK